MNARIIPAYAGSTAILRPVPGRRQDHPRIRGEHRIVCLNRWVATGSSPHTRGARLGHGHLEDHPGIIPAYAGSTSSAVFACRRSRDHPRIRGEHPRRGAGPHRGAGSSPHTRGARRRQAVPGLLRGIIPAYAGSTIVVADTHAAHADHPRIRGEHARRPSMPIASPGSSPHTRGAPLDPRPPMAPDRIIPAYAGSTTLSRNAAGKAPDHPRIRGEHIQRRGAPPRRRGSSPHTRGARARLPPGRTHPGIIPAYAGSTIPE